VCLNSLRPQQVFSAISAVKTSASGSCQERFRRAERNRITPAPVVLQPSDRPTQVPQSAAKSGSQVRHNLARSSERHDERPTRIVVSRERPLINPVADRGPPPKSYSSKLCGGIFASRESAASPAPSAIAPPAFRNDRRRIISRWPTTARTLREGRDFDYG
jgi:hypothetical protein